jgi:hypothetical protein
MLQKIKNRVETLDDHASSKLTAGLLFACLLSFSALILLNLI